MDMVGVVLVCDILDQKGQVRGLACVVVLCSWARHFTLTVFLLTQEQNGCWRVVGQGKPGRTPSLGEPLTSIPPRLLHPTETRIISCGTHDQSPPGYHDLLISVAGMDITLAWLPSNTQNLTG